MRKLIDAEVLKEYFKQQLAETLTRLKTEEIRQLAVDITEGLMNDIDAQLPANDWETMPIDGDCISRKAVLSLLADHFDNVFDMVKELPSVAIPSAYKGMTNGGIMHKLFPNDCFVVGEYGFDEKWWNSPYSEERSD